MDSTANPIDFNSEGRCNYCLEFERSQDGSLFSAENDDRASALALLVSKIKTDGVGKPYDCIVGVSGGVDSSYVLALAKSLGLRPLAVHMDNGWNSELAVSNIGHLIANLNVDLHTFVINWQTYKGLMQAFFDADVIDVELLYDNAMTAVCYQQAKKYGLQFILSGSNTSTEGMKMPPNWAWRDKWDGRNIKNIAERFGASLEGFPLFTNFAWLKASYLDKIKWVPFLDYVDYKKDTALACLIEEHSYQPYPYKHYENVFTRFYQGYILPAKFGVDKRRIHLSTLVMTSQLSREMALADLESIPYGTERELVSDKKYFLKKMGWVDEDLNSYVNRPEISHELYGTDNVRRFIWPILATLGKIRMKLLSFTNLK